MIEEVVDSIKDMGKSAKKALGKNGFNILLIVIVAIGAYLIYKSFHTPDESEDDYNVATGVASYPDAGENADVIISSLGNSIQYAEDEILQAIDDQTVDINEHTDDKFEELNDFISDGITTTRTVYESTGGGDSSSGLTGSDRDLTGRLQISANVPRHTRAKTSTISSSSSKSVGNTLTQVGVKRSTGSSSAARADTYTYKTKSGLNTRTSIVDALKATGANSSYENREKIAAANGIKNYSGTASQNVKLLTKLKTGNLVKPSSNSKSSSSSSKKSSSSSSKKSSSSSSKKSSSSSSKKSSSSSSKKKK